MPAVIALKEPSQPAYQKLLKQVQETIRKGRARVEREKVRTYWQVGKVLAGFIKRQPGYGEKVIPQLAKDLQTNRTQLYYSLEFYRAYKIVPARGQLTWTHYKALLAVNKPGRRDQLTALAQQHRWNVSRLRREIKAQKPGTVKTSLKKLSPRLGKLKTYRVVQIDGQPHYDLGFSCYKAIKSRVPKAKPRPQDLYTFKASLVRVIDGDTLWVYAALGFGFKTFQKLRLRGIDTPELKTRAGREAKASLEKLLAGQKQFLITTSKSDKYDRYLADLWVGKTCVNQRLIDQGEAVLA